MRIGVEITDLRESPAATAPVQTQALYGEAVTVFEEAEGWAWGQLASDSYVGYLTCDALVEPGSQPTHRVRAPRSFVYASASMKSPVLMALPMGATIRVVASEGLFAEMEDGGFIFAAHLDAMDRCESDFVGVAERFLDAPYLWGGKSWLGLDCSGLVQIALAQAGVGAPRDTDMMVAELGSALAVDLASNLRRGDLVFWKGHVGVMQDRNLLLHANGHHMQVASEPLGQATDRISRAGGGPITAIRRVG